MGNSSVKEKEPELKYQELGKSDLPSIILELVQLAKPSDYHLLRNEVVVFMVFPTVIENRFSHIS